VSAEPFTYVEAREPPAWQVELVAEVRGLLADGHDELASLVRRDWPARITWRRLEHPLERWQRERADRARGAILRDAPRVWSSAKRQAGACDLERREVLLDPEDDSELAVVRNLLHELAHYWNGPDEAGAREMERFAPKLLARLRLCRERGHHHERAMEAV